MRIASWIIKRIATGEIMLETYSPEIVAALLPEFMAIPILEHLVDVNVELKEQRE